MSKAHTPFVSLCVELLGEALGRVSARAMFGGWGIYRDGRMFGLIAEDTLYLKVDDKNRTAFEAEGLGPFVYDAKNKSVAMSYHEAPPDALDDPSAMRPWALSAYEAALRAGATKPKKSPVKSKAAKR